MHRQLIGLCVIATASFAVVAAEKDTHLAANTRAKKLTAKVTVDFKDEMLDECVKELSRQLDDAGLGSLSATYDTGVSRNQRVTFAAKDMAIADVLDAMLKSNNLGYYVVSKDKDRYDGWIKITKNDKERGWPAGQEPKGKTAAKPPATKTTPVSKDVPIRKTELDDAAKMEKTAETKLELARSLLKDGKKDKARQRFQEIVAQYPTSKAAAEAKKELEKLGDQ